jgi:hypothetical protein
MEITKTVRIEITEEELGLIRSSLCNQAIKELGHAHEVQMDCKQRGIQDITSQIYMEVHDKINKIIQQIDEAK